MSWVQRKLSEIAELSLGKMLDQHKNKGTPQPYLANLNVRWGAFDLGDLRQMRFESHEAERFGVRQGDIVMCEGGEPGRCAIWRSEQPGPMVQKALHRIRPLRGNHPEFLFYTLFHHARSGHLARLFTGATIKHLPAEKLALVEVRMPALQLQRRVAAILSAYDDLIENSQRRIKILEKMARSLYREWFVEFRFPGHEKVKFADSALGRIPEGWEVVDLQAVCDDDKGIQTGPFGSQLHESDYSDVGVPVVMPKDLIGYRIRTDSIARIPEATAEKLGRHRMKPGDIVYGRRGDIGRRAFLMPFQDGWFCGTGCLRLRPKPSAISGWFLFNYLGQDDVVGLIAGRAQGVTMPNLNTCVMATVPVVLPPRKLQSLFEQMSFPLTEERESLTATRQARRSSTTCPTVSWLSAAFRNSYRSTASTKNGFGPSSFTGAT